MQKMFLKIWSKFKQINPRFSEQNDPRSNHNWHDMWHLFLFLFSLAQRDSSKRLTIWKFVAQNYDHYNRYHCSLVRKMNCSKVTRVQRKKFGHLLYDKSHQFVDLLSRTFTWVELDTRRKSWDTVAAAMPTRHKNERDNDLMNGPFIINTWVVF